MYIVTGKITEEGKEKAYSVFGIKEQKTCLVTKKELKQMVKNNADVCGYDILNSAGIKTKTFKKTKKFLWDRIPELTGRLQVENEKDKNLQILVGTNGFKEIKHYITVKPSGEIYVYSENKLKAEIRKNNIIGAVIDTNNRLMLYIHNEINDFWIMKLGYKRDEDGFWEYDELEHENIARQARIDEINEKIRETDKRTKALGLTAFNEKGGIKRDKPGTKKGTNN